MSAIKPIIQKLAVILFQGTGSVYTDFSQQAYSFTRDPFTLTMNPSNGDYLYLGRPKAFNAVYVHLPTPAAAGLTLSAQYWNGTAWSNLVLLTEDTAGFSRSGFIKWDKMALLQGSATDWAPTTVNNNGNLWNYIRLQLSAVTNPTGIQAQGIGLVFADDRDMKEIQPNILRYLPKDELNVLQKDFISAHVAAKEKILVWFKEAGIKKFSVADGNYWDVDEWDFHNVDQLRTAAKYLALSHTHGIMVVETDDMYDKKAKSYYGMAKSAITLPLCSLDTNDDGYEGIEEKNSQFSAGYVTR